MYRFVALVRAFVRNRSGVSTADWVGSTAVFFILTAAAVYAILGDEDGGLVAIVNGKQEQLADRTESVNDMITEVDAWSPGGS